MRKIKSSVLAMLSAAVLLFSSCLGDSDYTPSYGGLGTPLGDMSGSAMLDDGVIDTSSGILDMELMNIDRIFVYGQVTSEYKDVEQVQKGDKIAIVPQYALVLDEVEELQGENSFENVELSDIDELSWFTVLGGIFNASNGYMNFTIVGDCYTKTSTSSGSTTETMVSPYYYLHVSRVDTDAKIVDLELGYDNRASECTDTEGKLKDGYMLRQNTSFPIYFDTTSLYNQLDGLDDEDTITFNIYKVEKEDNGRIEKNKVNLSYTSIQKGALKRTVRTY